MDPSLNFYKNYKQILSVVAATHLYHTLTKLLNNIKQTLILLTLSSTQKHHFLSLLRINSKSIPIHP